MTASRTTRRIVALLCLAALLLLALGHSGHGLPLAILVPFWIVLALVLVVSFAGPERPRPLLSPALARAVPSRAPPAL